MITRKPLYVVLSRILTRMLPLLFLAIATTLAFAQADQATLTGVVADKTGAVLPGAEVTLTNTGTNLTLKTQTDSSGAYIFSPVKIGDYKVVVSAGGFATVVRENIHLDVQQRLSLDFTLTPGGVTNTVTVTDLPPLMQTEESSVGQVIPTATIEQTPLNGRNWIYIAQLTAGVDPPEGTRGAGKGDFNANGQRAEQNNYILDGVDNNASSVDLINGASYVVRPPPDALAEFKIQTGDYAAEFGHSAGAVVNASVKSGTNKIHGSLWEYVRNTDFDAKDWDAASVPVYHENQFGTTLGLPLLKNKLFFFGDMEANRIAFAEPNTFTVPTALMRSGNFSELLPTGAVISNLTDPGTSNPMGTACGTETTNPNVMCPSSLASAGSVVALALLNLYPANPGTQVFNGVGDNYQTNRPALDNTLQYDVRVDWNVSSKDQAFARFSYLNEPGSRTPPLGPLVDGGNNVAYGDDGNIKNRGDNFVLSETHIFSSTLANEFRFGYNWGHFAFLQSNANNTGLSAAYGLGGIPGGNVNGGFPAINIGNLSTFGSEEYYPANEYQNGFQILDNVSKNVGRHMLKAGASFQKVRVFTFEPPASRGEENYYSGNDWECGSSGITFTGNGVSDFLADMQGCASISNLAQSDDVHWAQAYYVQDDWKVNTKLTLNLGVRYEYAQPYRERYGHQAEWYPTVPLRQYAPGDTPSVFEIPQQRNGQAVSLGTQSPEILGLNYTGSDPYMSLQLNDSNPALLTAAKDDYVPRFGFTYIVNPKVTARGGFGMFDGGLESVGYSPNLGMNFPFGYISNYYGTNGVATDGISLATGFTNVISQGLLNAVTSPGLNGSDPNPKTPYTESYNLAVEVGINKDTVATLSYVGSSSRHLLVMTDPNAALGLTNPNDNTAPQEMPLPAFGKALFSSYSGESNYNAFQVKLEKRLSRGLSYLAAYTWSHALDDAPTPLGANGDNGYSNTNIQPIRGQYSNSPFDTRQRFTVNGNYSLPNIKRGGVPNYLLGGWSASLTFAAQTGNPFSVLPNSSTSGGAYSQPGGFPSGVNYAVKVGDPFKGGGTPPSNFPAGFVCPTSVRNATNWYNPCAFSYPQNGTLIPLGTAVSGAAALPYIGGRRTDIYGPGYERVNMSAFKDFKITKATLEFRADAFNLLNTPSYANPNNGPGGGPAVGHNDLSESGGWINQAKMFQAFTPDSRFFQLSLKLSY